MEGVQKGSYFITRKKYNYLTGWYELKDPKGKPEHIRIAKTVKINGKQIVQI